MRGLKIRQCGVAPQIHKVGQIQHSEGSIIAAITVHNDGFYSRIQCIQLFDRMNSGIRVGDE